MSKKASNPPPPLNKKPPPPPAPPNKQTNNPDIEFLKEFMNKINSQNNRCTATPYYFVVREQEEVLDGDGNFAELYRWVDKGIFFTEEAANNHIKQNYYHYNNPRTYVKHAFRNPEMKRLFKAIGNITGVEYVEH